jgi:hypothetical protein
MSEQIKDGPLLLGSVVALNQDESLAIWQTAPISREIVRISPLCETIITGAWDEAAKLVLERLRETEKMMLDQSIDKGTILDSCGWQTRDEEVIRIYTADGRVELGQRFASNPFWQYVLLMSASSVSPS